MRRLFRSLRQRLSLSEPRRAYRPDFTDERFFRDLAFASRESVALGSACMAFERSDPEAAVTSVVEHFRHRDVPRFFFDIERLPWLLSSIERKYPGWKRRAVEQVTRECERGVAVYAAKTAPLGHGFDWTGLTRGPGDDPLYSIRPHFFEFAPAMGRAVAFGEPRGALLEQLLVAWMGMSARGDSPLPYASDLTAGLRILALSWAWAFVAGYASTASQANTRLEIALLKVLRADGEFLESQVEGATPNNHKLTAGFVLWYLGSLFPELAGARGWKEQGLRVWLTELERQVLPDGGEFEHSIGYHLSVCEAISAFILLSRRNGQEVPRWVLERGRAALGFHAAVAGGGMGRLGDAADYSLFPLLSFSDWTTASVRELGRAIFGLPCALAQVDDPGVEQAFWLLGGAMAPRSEESKPTFVLQSYPDSGFYVFSSSEPGTSLLFRAGPRPGRPLFAGHMHADLLSVYVSSRGKAVVVEAGTYTYRLAPRGWPVGAPRWRAYFAGPESHNGLSIEGEDPLGAIDGDFRPREVATRVEARAGLAASLLAWAEGIVEGPSIYAGCTRGVITLDQGFWIVYDIIGDRAPLVDVSFGFQLAPGSRARRDSDGTIRAEIDGETLAIVPSKGLRHASTDIGQLHPPRGWVSEAYGALVPAPQVRFRSDETSRSTAFVLAQNQAASVCRSVAFDHLACGSKMIEIYWSDHTDRIIVTGKSGRSAAFGADFDGSLLWFRSHGSQLTALRWLNGRAVRIPHLSLEIRAERSMESLGLELTARGLEAAGTMAGVTVAWPGASLAES